MGPRRALAAASLILLAACDQNDGVATATPETAPRDGGRDQPPEDAALQPTLDALGDATATSIPIDARAPCDEDRCVYVSLGSGVEAGVDHELPTCGDGATYAGLSDTLYVLASNQPAPTELTVHEGIVYWLNGPIFDYRGGTPFSGPYGPTAYELKRISSGGTDEAVLHDGGGCCGYSFRTELVFNEGSLYWREPTERIWRQPGGSASPRTVFLEITEADTFFGRFTGGDDALYYQRIAQGGGEVVCNPFGCGAPDLHTLRRASYDGSSDFEIADLGASGRLTDLAVDATHVYWASAFALSRAPKQGTVDSSIATIPEGISSIALHGDDVFGTYRGNLLDDGGSPLGAVWRVSKDGSDFEILHADRANPTELAVAGSDLFWIEAGECGAVVRAPLNGGPPVVIAADQPNPWRIAVDDNALYWTNRGRREWITDADLVAHGAGTLMKLTL